MAGIVQTVVHRGGDLFTIHKAEPRCVGANRMPDIFNLRFRYNRCDAEVLAGGGIYAVYFRGELLYIGLFTGKGRKAFASNVASQRFYKHLEALTLRGRTIDFSASNYKKVCALKRPSCPLIRSLQGTQVPWGNSAVKTYPCKVEFASDNWDAFSRIERDQSVLNGFTFVYGRIDCKQFSGNITYQRVKNYLSVIENDLISDYSPRCNIRGYSPRCDEKFVSSNARHLAGTPGRSAWTAFGKLVGDHIRTGNGRSAGAAPGEDK
jgi:hypothetical protein